MLADFAKLISDGNFFLENTLKHKKNVEKAKKQ
jgi:hypothetical protein